MVNNTAQNTNSSSTPPVRLEASWRAVLDPEFGQPYFRNLSAFVHEAYGKTQVYPAPKNIFRALEQTPFDQVRVVVLGQDPYHGAGQANGLAFAVGEQVAVPPSLQNIYKEIEAEFGTPAQGRSGDLTQWAKQGVLLLNATLTVEAGKAGSHQGRGWETFTDAIVRALSTEREHLVFLLWGRYAQQKGAHIDRTKHLVLEAAHPSPFSAYNGFFGCGHFKKANEYLVEHGEKPIEW